MGLSNISSLIPLLRWLLPFFWPESQPLTQQLAHSSGTCWVCIPGRWRGIGCRCVWDFSTWCQPSSPSGCEILWFFFNLLHFFFWTWILYHGSEFFLSGIFHWRVCYLDPHGLCDSDKGKMLLFSVRAVKQYLNGTKQCCHNCSNLFFPTGCVKKKSNRTVVAF